MLSLLRYECLPSTNDEAKRLAVGGAPGGTAIWALRQTRGRGRRGALWHSPEGNAFVSVIVRPGLDAGLAGRLAVAAGQAVALTLSDLSGAAIRTKWPNDIVLDGRKLGGILVETGVSVSRVQWAVVGVGINVAHAPQVEPPGLPAARLADAGWRGGLEEVVGAVATAVGGVGETCAAEARWLDVQRRWSAMDDTRGPVIVVEADGTWEGTGVGLDADGALLVETPAGVRRVTTEVSVRPSSA